MRPKLTVEGVQFSEMIPPALERRWTAIVTIDASRCAANASGYCDLGITRQKESGYELDFREQFIWLAPSVWTSRPTRRSNRALVGPPNRCGILSAL
jgi:hypothetical protein